MAETLCELLPPHLQVADFLGQLLDEVVGPDVVRDLAGGLAHLQGLTHTSVQAGGMKRGREKEKRESAAAPPLSPLASTRSAVH